MKSLCACVLVIFAARAVAAQGFSSAERAEVAAGALTRATSAAADSAVQVAPVFSLEGTTKDKVATARIGFQLTDFTLSFAFKAAIDDDGSPATFADLDGLRKKSTGEMGLLWSRWDIQDPSGALTHACERYAMAKEKKLDEIECSILALKRDTSAAGKRALKSILRQVNPGTVFYLGGKATLAPEKFDYLVEQDLTQATENHTSWSASAVTGVLLPSGILIAGDYTRQVAYTAGKKAQVCGPIGSTTSLKCADKVIGAPKDPDRTNQVGVELREFFNEHFAISPKVTYDWTKNAAGIEVPLYLLKDGSGGLTGGITLGWRSDTKAWTASAFVGQVLGLITKAD